MQKQSAILRPEGVRSRRFKPKHPHLTRKLLNAIIDHEDHYITPITAPHSLKDTRTKNLYKLWCCNLRYVLHGEPYTKRILGSVCTSTVCRIYEFGSRSAANDNDDDNFVFVYDTERATIYDRGDFESSHGTGITMCDNGRQLVRHAIRVMLAHIDDQAVADDFYSLGSATASSLD